MTARVHGKVVPAIPISSINAETAINSSVRHAVLGETTKPALFQCKTEKETDNEMPKIENQRFRIVERQCQNGRSHNSWNYGQRVYGL